MLIKENEISQATLQTVGAIFHTESETIFNHQEPPQVLEDNVDDDAADSAKQMNRFKSQVKVTTILM